MKDKGSSGAPGMMFLPAIGSTIVVLTTGDHIKVPAIVTAVWGEGMVNCTTFGPDGSVGHYGSIHPNGHPRAGVVTWEWPGEVRLVPMSDLGWR